MPRFRDGFPRPKKEYHHGAWRIAWRWDGKKYSVATNITDKDAISDIESYVRNLTGQLSVKGRPEITTPWKGASGVERYITDRFGPEPLVGSKPKPSSDKWIVDYAMEIKGECSERWAEMSITRLRALDAESGGLATLSPENASRYLAEIASKRKTGTRNRFLATFSRFYKWAVRTGRTTINPFAGIKTLKEEQSLDIVYCTPEERAEIIAMAESTGWKDWLAVPIAFYSGMRREEVANLEWPDVRFTEGIIVVRKTKTKKGRTIPLNANLESLLSSRPIAERSGYVVKIASDIDRILRMDNLVRVIQKAKQKKLLAKWDIIPPAPSRSKDYAAKKKEFEAAKRKRGTVLKATLNRIGWNPFRHTFGSLLAQAGVSLDKISSWMGNTPEVCRRHYAQFIPRDRRDNEIDKL